jgi:hypothetical protein
LQYLNIWFRFEERLEDRYREMTRLCQLRSVQMDAADRIRLSSHHNLCLLCVNLYLPSCKCTNWCPPGLVPSIPHFLVLRSFRVDKPHGQRVLSRRLAELGNQQAWDVPIDNLSIKVAVIAEGGWHAVHRASTIYWIFRIPMLAPGRLDAVRPTQASNCVFTPVF